MQFSRTLAVVLVVCILAGCRTYGGHGTVEANNARLHAASAKLTSSAESASSDLQRLAASGRFDPNVLDAYRAVVEEHTTEAEELAMKLETSGTLNYRDASRLLGGVITDQHEYENKYQALLRSMAGDMQAPDPERASRYHVVPAAWFKASDRALTVDDVLGNTP